MPTVDEALVYLGIDYADAAVEANVQRALATAEAVMRGAVGQEVRAYLPDDPRVDQLVLIYTDDLYSDRSVSAKVSSATRRMVADIELQLRLALRQAHDQAEVMG